ncbi:hypothetical protein C8J56DRAFT_1084776 [Mycena floridula]|nr:hypothetical protein C8J56DRAFT_1084776 [Mycena floridula]
MYGTNPFAQAGWANPYNGSSSTNSQQVWIPNGNPPEPSSVYGALPFAPSPAPILLLSFRFTSLSPSITNCTVVGPQSQPYFRVVTDASSKKGFTFFENAQGKIVGSITWRPYISVEVGDAVPKQKAKHWLSLSPDGTFRTMECRGKKYTWVPQDQALCLYTQGPMRPEFLARVSRGQDGQSNVEISASAIHIGLMEACVVAVVLMQSGKPIE